MRKKKKCVERKFFWGFTVCKTGKKNIIKINFNEFILFYWKNIIFFYGLLVGGKK